MNHLQRFTHYAAVSVEVPLPELVAEDDDSLRIFAVKSVRGLQPTAQRRRNSKVLEGIRAEVVGGDVFGQIGAGDGQIPLIGSECVLDHRGLANLLPLSTGKSDSLWSTRARVNAQMDHAVGPEIGVGIDQETIDHAEDGRGGADAKRQREDSGKREPRHLDQLPDTVADVL